MYAALKGNANIVLINRVFYNWWFFSW